MLFGTIRYRLRDIELWGGVRLHVRRYSRYKTTLIIIFYLLSNLSIASIGSREIEDTNSR